MQKNKRKNYIKHTFDLIGDNILKKKNSVNEIGRTME